MPGSTRLRRRSLAQRAKRLGLDARDADMEAALLSGVCEEPPPVKTPALDRLMERVRAGEFGPQGNVSRHDAHFGAVRE